MVLNQTDKEYKKLPWLAKVISLRKWSEYMYLCGQINVMKDTIKRTK